MKTITAQQVRAYFHPRRSFLLRGRSSSPPETPIGQAPIGSLAPFGRPPAVGGGSGQYSRAIEGDLSNYPRKPNTNKGDYGHLLAIGGSANKPGAILLSGKAALRTGAGLVTVALPDRAFRKLSKNFLELMYEPFPSTSEMQRVMRGKNAIVVGPGMGTGSRALLQNLLRVAKVPMVLDADALNILAILGKRVFKFATTCILTPHPGEMARLTGLTTAEIQKDRVGCAGRFAKKWRVILVLKGFRTVIAMPDGRIFINPTGNPGMATAGMGDVLTGVIGGLLAQGLAPEQATIAGVFVHGLAGDRVAKRLGDRGLLASDVIEELPLTFKKLIP